LFGASTHTAAVVARCHEVLNLPDATLAALVRDASLAPVPAIARHTPVSLRLAKAAIQRQEM
jgi:hypothetical protein